MLAVKCVTQRYLPTPGLLSLLDNFRSMVNECIRVALNGNGNPITSVKALSLRSYHSLNAFDVAVCYRLTAISAAAGLVKNYRKSLKTNPKTQKPHVKRKLCIDCYSFKIEGDTLRLTTRPREYEYLKLNKHTLEMISQARPRSVIITENLLSISCSREIAQVKPRSLIGIDANLDNVMWASTIGGIRRFDLSKANQAKEKARNGKRGLKRNDVRIRRVIYRKFGEIQHNRVARILHNVSARIVRQAVEQKSAVVMEDLRHIRNLYRKGNGQGRNYRAG